MKWALLRCVMLAVIFVAFTPCYGDGKVDYDKMELLVTNQLVALRHSAMKASCLAAIKAQTGANDYEIANCLGSYIRAKGMSSPYTQDYELCLSALGLFSRIANEEQYSLLADIAKTQTNAIATISFGHYFRRMRKRGGLQLVEQLLDDKELSPAMRVEIIVTLKKDAGDVAKGDDLYRRTLCQLGRRQIAKRQHCHVFDEMLNTIDPEYKRSDLRRGLLRDVSKGKIPKMKLSPTGEEEGER